MSSVVWDKLDATGSIVTPTITLNSLASSSTAGRQSDVITLIDGSARVPPMIDVELALKLTTGTLANDKAAYLFMARSLDESAYEVGPPAIGATDAAFTFSFSPVGSSALPTDLYLVGAVTFNAQSEQRRKSFRVAAPFAKFAFVVLNYSGIALDSSGNSIKFRKRWPEVV